MLLSFSWSLTMIKSALFLLLWISSSQTFLFLTICCSCSLDETFLAIVRFNMQVDVSCFDMFWQIQPCFIAKRPIYFYSLWNTSKVLKFSIWTKKIAKGNLNSAKIKIIPLAEKKPVPCRAISSNYEGTWWVFHIMSHEKFVVMRCFSNQYFWFLIHTC